MGRSDTGPIILEKKKLKRRPILTKSNPANRKGRFRELKGMKKSIFEKNQKWAFFMSFVPRFVLRAVVQ